MSWLLVGVVLGALLIGVPAVRGERVRRSRVDLRYAKTRVKTERTIFWRALGAFLAAAIGPAVIATVLVVLYLIGRN